MKRFALALILFTAPAFAAFQEEAGCKELVTAAFKGKTFGSAKTTVFDEGDAEKACEMNSAANAKSCIAKVKSARGHMLAYGVAIVCGGGVTGDDALKCLGVVEKKMPDGRWPLVVDSCAGLARQVAKCEPESASPSCVDTGTIKPAAGAKTAPARN